MSLTNNNNNVNRTNEQYYNQIDTGCCEISTNLLFFLRFSESVYEEILHKINKGLLEVIKNKFGIFKKTYWEELKDKKDNCGK